MNTAGFKNDMPSENRSDIAFELISMNTARVKNDMPSEFQSDIALTGFSSTQIQKKKNKRKRNLCLNESSE